MSAPINNGGPAFPHTHESWHSYPDRMAQPPSGMSLRDWFAGQALAGLLTQPAEIEFGPGHFAKASYKMADAMLAAREVQP